ncbi:MAG: alanine--glyoxylate aminotransferase family protein [Clostridiales Family XIII bacterium]|nr:alanine--glyoxylate aminotransferase family protein [Clostridiales Family XIII bacterium]
MYNSLDDIPATLLLGAGPSGVAPSTYHALSKSIIGHMDPFFIRIMDELKDGLRLLFGTRNELTVPLSGTGSSGMEAAFVNLVEKGDKVLILQNGVFGTRMVDVAGRLGAEVTELAFEWGKPVDVDRVADQLGKDRYKIVAVVFAETSTGVRNPAKEIGDLLKGTDALYLVDAVTAIGGIPVEADNWGVDICYAGGQKCLSCPPGASPITFSDRAVEAIKNRKTKVPNWYLDMTLLTAYWGGGTRVYHHTPPVNMMYALYQAVYNILEEGIDNVFARHERVHKHLAKGLAEIGWAFLVDEPYRLPELNTVVVPEGVDEAALRKRLLNEYHIEINGGLGALAGKIVRIGLMGYNAKEENVDRLITAMKEIL